MTEQEIDNILNGFIAAFFAGLIPGYIAYKKGYSFFLWWLYGFAILLFALPHSLLLKMDAQRLENRRLAQGYTKCPHCKELIKQGASVCRFCNKPIG